MVSLNFHPNYSLHFPPLPKPYSRPKQRHLRKTRNHNAKNNKHDHTRICIDDLNDTLLELIFTSLQWRHLATCKCVSARWNSIISNPDFLRLLPIEQYSAFTLYLKGKEREYSDDKSCGTCLVTEHPYFQTHRLRLGFLPGSDKYIHTVDKYIHTVANHKDLLVTYRTLNQKSGYYIANPLTKQFIVILLPSGIHYSNYSSWITCLAVGFAGIVEGVSTPRVTNSNDYNNDGFRIVRFVENYNNGIKLQIYSSKTGLWTSYPSNNIGFNFRYLNKKGVTLNNKVCFDGASQILVVDPFDDDIIVTPCVLNLPDEINSRHVLGVSRNRLHIAQLEEQSSNVSEDYPRIKVWEFEDLTMSYSITKMAELRLVIDFPLKPYLFERIMPPIFQIFPPIKSWRWNDRVICCHPYDPYIVYFIYRDTFYRCDVVKQRLKVITYCVDDWNETYVFLHPLMTTK